MLQKKIYNWLKNNTQGKQIFYIDGGTSQDKRDYYKSELKEGTGKIMVASFGTLSTGISIKNIHTIFFTESYKSERVIKQSIGRGMRQLEGKQKVTIIDFIDDFSLGKDNRTKNNYLLNHGKERMRIYKKDYIPENIKVYNKDLNGLF